MHILDTRGQQCPAPLIATRKALRESPDGTAFRILTGSRNALNNISKFLTDNKIIYSVQEEPDFWTITVNKGNDNESAAK